MYQDQYSVHVLCFLFLALMNHRLGTRAGQEKDDDDNKMIVSVIAMLKQPSIHEQEYVHVNFLLL